MRTCSLCLRRRGAQGSFHIGGEEPHTAKSNNFFTSSDCADSPAALLSEVRHGLEGRLLLPGILELIRMVDDNFLVDRDRAVAIAEGLLRRGNGRLHAPGAGDARRTRAPASRS